MLAADLPSRGPATGAIAWTDLAWALLPMGLGLGLRWSGLDLAIADHYFNFELGTFPARASALLELVGHRAAKSVMLATWFVLLGAAIASHFDRGMRRWRPILWATVLGMALGPAVVAIFKSHTSFPCPWDLDRYGGLARESADIFVARAQAGHCFPAGHAAGGFSLFAVFFGLKAAGHNGWARRVLVVTVLVGLAFSQVRVVQGAHFASHACWSAAVDWLAAGLPFVLLGCRAPRRHHGVSIN